MKLIKYTRDSWNIKKKLHFHNNHVLLWCHATDKSVIIIDLFCKISIDIWMCKDRSPLIPKYCNKKQYYIHTIHQPHMVVNYLWYLVVLGYRHRWDCNCLSSDYLMSFEVKWSLYDPMNSHSVNKIMVVSNRNDNKPISFWL